jgi:DNA replication and repair protein RecF
MKLDSVQISQFRNIERLSIKLDSRLNIFVGENGSGKSSILEAIHYLGFARSFRTSKHKSVIKAGTSGFTVFCQIEGSNESKRLGIQRSSDDQCLVNIDGIKSRKATDLVSQLPVQIFTPQSSELLTGSPKLRRKYLDWLLFHVEHPFNANAQIYAKAIKSVNAIYRKGSYQGQSSQIDYWRQLLIERGNLITEMRSVLVTDRLAELINLNLTEFLPEFSFEISYYRGWERSLSFEECLSKNFEKDQKNGFVSVGPHKADLKIKANGLHAQEILSRGQLRMLVAAMQLAQTEYLYEVTGRNSIFLLDDIGAELDVEKRSAFISKLHQSESQIFVTAIDNSHLEFLANYNENKVFHVEHGCVKEKEI